MKILTQNLFFPIPIDFNLQSLPLDAGNSGQLQRRARGSAPIAPSMSTSVFASATPNRSEPSRQTRCTAAQGPSRHPCKSSFRLSGSFAREIVPIIAALPHLESHETLRCGLLSAAARLSGRRELRMVVTKGKKNCRPKSFSRF